MLIVVCPECQSRLKLKSSFAGRRVKCPKCQAVVKIPSAQDGEASTPEQQRVEPSASAPQVAPQTPDTSNTNEESPVLPLAPESSQPTVPQQMPDFAAAPELNFDTSPQNSSSSPRLTKRRRKRRSSAGIWVPMVLGLLSVIGAVWYFLPQETIPEVVARQFPDQAATEGKLMKLTMPVAANGGQKAQLKIIKAPEGAKIEPGTHEFTWTPGESDGARTFDVTVHVNQGAQIVEAKFRIVVAEDDKPPVFIPVQPVEAKPLEEVRVSLKAHDPDAPAAAVQYSLAEPGAATKIDAKSGQLTFAPTEVMAGESVSVNVVAKEDSAEGLSTTQSVTFNVLKFDDPVRQLVADLRKIGADASLAGDDPTTASLPFTGEASTIAVAQHPVSVFRYETGLARQADVQKIDEVERKIFNAHWENEQPLNVFAKDSLLVAFAGDARNVLSVISAVADRPVAVVQKYEAPVPVVHQPTALVAAMLPLYEERMKKPGKPRRLFSTDCYKEVRKTFADQFAEQYDSEIRTGLGDDYDEVMEWFAERIDLKEEFFTAIQPDVDNVSTAMQLFNEIRRLFPKKIDRYGSLAIACAVVWDNDRGVYNYHGHANRTHSAMPENLLDGLDNFQYFTDAESVMQGRAQFIPWEFLIHLVNHRTPVKERVWAARNYISTRQMFGKCYADVPYDTMMLQTKSRECRLGGKEYNLPNLREFGGVCAMQADFAARVGKSMGVPAEYVTGQGRYGGAHAWVMWVELNAVSQRSIKFTLESHGRYRGDHYYVGKMKEPQSGERITDRILELRLHQIGMDALAKRHSDRIMTLYPQIEAELTFDFDTHLDYLSGAVSLNPWNEAAWSALSGISTGREISRDEYKLMSGLLNQLFVNFAAFPDFTLTIFGDLISFEQDVKKRIAYYYQLLEVYSAAQRPDLGFRALLQLADVLEEEERTGEAIQALAVAIQKYPDEGQYIPNMLDRLEALATSKGAVDQTLAEFYASFLPKIPKSRGKSPSKYCMQMYERAVPVFERAGQQQLAQSYRAGAAQMKAGMPQ